MNTTANPRDRERFKPRVQAIDVAGRVPPHNEDAEAAVLSAVLTDARSFDIVVDVLPNGDAFYTDAHRRIFDAAVELHAKNQPVDIQTVANFLKDRDRLQAIGGLTYLSRLVDATPAVAHVDAHARIVRDKYIERRLIETCQMVAAEGYGDHGTTEAYVESAEQRIFEIARVPQKERPTLLFDSIKATFEQLQEAFDTGRAIMGVPSGFSKLDAMTSGMHAGELIIVAGRPGQGKTSYALNIAANAAQLPPDPEFGEDPAPLIGVMVFSLEMPKSQITMRMLCGEGRIDVSKLRRGTLGRDDWDRMIETSNVLSGLPIWIDDTPSISVLELRAKVRRQQAEFDKKHENGKDKQRVGLVIVDYLQLMKGRADAKSREQEISEISRGLKALAKDLGLPVMALSQLNRAVETRGGKDKRPQLSDLRESGAIEQDADMVQFIYRPEYYMADKNTPEAVKVKGLAEVIVAKQRNGPTGRVPLTFLDVCTRFENRDPSLYMGDSDD